MQKLPKASCLDPGAKDYGAADLAKATTCHMAYEAKLEKRVADLQAAIKELDGLMEAELKKGN